MAVFNIFSSYLKEASFKGQERYSSTFSQRVFFYQASVPAQASIPFAFQQCVIEPNSK